MESLIRRLSPTVEFLIVIFGSLGLSILSSTLSMIASYQANKFIITLHPGDLYSLICFEIVILVMLYVFLKIRGWTIRDFNLEINWKLAAFALVILGVNYLLTYLVYIVLVISHLIPYPSTTIFKIFLTLPEILMASIVNPIFEEIIVIGYVFKALKKKHKGLFIIGMSALIRYSYHTCQGSIALASILPMGFLYAYVYWRWKKILPLVIAHALEDFIGLYSYLQT